VMGNAIAVLALCLAFLAGCDNMDNQPKQKAFSPLVGPAAAPGDTVEFQSQPVKAPAVTLDLLDLGRSAIAFIAHRAIQSWATDTE
jgi:hypothetical protein